MGKIVVVIFILAFSVFADNHIINEKYLQGTWVKITWSKKVRNLLHFMKLNEKKFESITFAGKYYLFYSSNNEYLYLKNQRIHNLYSYKIITHKNNAQWISFKNGTQMMGINNPSRWVYWGITKITKDLVGPKKNKKLVDLQLGDIVLTLYNSKTKKIIYRKQFRKIPQKK